MRQALVGTIVVGEPESREGFKVFPVENAKGRHLGDIVYYDRPPTRNGWLQPGYNVVIGSFWSLTFEANRLPGCQSMRSAVRAFLALLAK